METLYHGDWLDLISWDNYEFVDEPFTIVAIPIRTDGDEIRIGVRREYCPSYFYPNSESLYYTLITGQIEEGETAEEALERELEEEAGIRCISTKYSDLSNAIPVVKFSSTRTTPFLIWLKPGTFEEVEAYGDGTENEKKSETLWVTIDEVKRIVESKENFDFLFLFLRYFLDSCF